LPEIFPASYECADPWAEIVPPVGRKDTSVFEFFVNGTERLNFLSPIRTRLGPMTPSLPDTLDAVGPPDDARDVVAGRSPAASSCGGDDTGFELQIFDMRLNTTDIPLYCEMNERC
jgi:hypothetical protein